MNNVRKKWIIRIIALILLLIVSGVLATWVYAYYLPMRRAQPIIEKLGSGKPKLIKTAVVQLIGQKVNDEGKVYFDHRPLRGSAARQVKEEVIKVLKTTEDEDVLAGFFLYVIMGSPGATGLEFTEHDWQVIKKATEVYNEQQKRSGRYSLFRVVKEDEGYVLYEESITSDSFPSP